ncbi:peptide chain release factor N(5)-glutamine methyltransferase [Limibacillus sp. MBR-115]|uniref:peptide chain release factor N(5)-glutamine methyltransferase n=1 Tax=Limibacillus sp. MBR-115 TaxID=3156465 RepID=UPI0033977FA8
MTAGRSGCATAGALLSAATIRLSAAGIEAARREARLLLAQALSCDPQKLFQEPGYSVNGKDQQVFETLVSRRLAGVPLSRLRGWREFWSLRFKLSAETLDPRADSETLIEAALARIKNHDEPQEFLDLGTGSGCLLLALLSEYPNAWGLGIDLSYDAAATASENARSLGLGDRAAFLCGDWAASLVCDGARRFDLVVSNPPYINALEFDHLAPEVRLHDPCLALAGGDDGLACYRILIPQVLHLVKEGGLLLLEIGSMQAQAVVGLLSASGWTKISVLKDLAGLDRCIAACR